MTRLLSISLVSVGVLAAAAATVPQQTLEDYYFSRPNMTNLTGTVIGDPPAYNVLRREDLAWIYEAAQERQALASRSWRGPGSHIASEPRFGHWPLASSNQFARYVVAHEWRNGHFETNIVVGYVSVTNNGTGRDWPRYTGEDMSLVSDDTAGSGLKRYLAPDTNDFLRGTATWPAYNLPSHTNVTVSVYTNYPAHIGWPPEDNTTQHVEIVTMPMTNGTVSVYTNKWSENLRQVTTNTVTNVVAGADYDLLFVGRQPKWYAEPVPPPMRVLPRYSYIRECYDYLRGMRYLLDETHNTNGVEVIYWQWFPDYRSDGTVPEISASSPTYGTNNYPTVWVSVWSGGEPTSGTRLLAFPSAFSWEVVHTGGVCRIRSATLYACVSVYVEYSNFIDHATDYEVGGYYAVRLGEATKAGTPDPYGFVVFEKAVDVRGLLYDAMSALGGEYIDMSTGYWWGSSVSIAPRFYLLYEMQPNASLPDW